MYKVKINGKIIYAEEGSLLKDVLTDNGFRLEHPCGGRGVCKKCRVKVDGEEMLSCQYIIKSDISVEFYEVESETFEYNAENCISLDDEGLFCLDLGTTTLALGLVSLNENKIIGIKTAQNPQKAYGNDVMSRLEYATKNGVEKLQKAVVSEINKLIEYFGVGEVETLTVAGNPTMLHILFGINPETIGFSPYTPVFLNEKCENAENLGISGVKRIVSLPSISSFVGADIVAGLCCVDMPKSGKYSFLVDLGTNAEIVLYSNEAILCTSAAAGPCFEGANISQGMGAQDGAITGYTSDGKAEIIGNKPAVGICGTGLVDIISSLLEKGIIDKTGFMECEKYEVANGVFLTQEDVRQYQLAKSAIYSGIMSLLKHKGIDFEDIDKMFVSGGFSAKMNISSAVKTGLLPKNLETKCVSLGNTSLLGTVKSVIEKTDLNRFTENARYLDLSTNTVFSDLFIANMMFE